MADFLNGYHSILEIGTGDGTGTSVLAARGHQVVSLDLNPFCLDRAEKTLRSAGIGSQRQVRQTEFFTKGNGYGIRYGDFSAPPSPRPPVLLVETDTWEDSKLPDWLSLLGPFDGLALWCVGAHGCRSGFQLEQARQFRINTRGRTFELADQFLRRGGIMHYVDRMPALAGYTDHIAMQKRDLPSLLTKTALVVTDVQVRETKSLQAPTGVRVGHAPVPGQKADMYALVGVTLTKT
jgi:hypothetical protein